MEALKIVMVPVAAWVLGLLVVALKIFLVVLALGVAVGVGVFIYKRQQKAAAEA